MKHFRGDPARHTASDADLVERLERLAADAPDRLLYVELLDGVTETARLTAGELHSRAQGVAAALRETGVRAGQVVLLLADRPAEFLVGLTGCFWAGVIAAPIASPRRPEHLQSRLAPVRANAGAVAVLAGTPQRADERAVLDLIVGGELPVLELGALGSASLPPVAERDVAYLQYTSGSTSDPRGVIVSHGNLVANLELCPILLGMDAESVNVSWCPLTHDMGLILGALPSMAFGITSVLMPPGAFIRRPMAWLRAMDRYRGTHGYSPNFGYDLCVSRSTEEERAALDLSCVRTLVNGAEPVRAATRERFIAAFASSGLRPDAHAPGYGLAESSVVVSIGPAGSPGATVTVEAAALERHRVVPREPGGEGVRELCTDGLPGPGYDLRIVDPHTGTPLPPDEVGELWVRGPSVCRGYWRREDATRETFGATIPGDDGGPYLRTGDLAFLYDQEIVICGRIKDLIVIRGRNIHPQDVETAVESAHPALRIGGSAAFAIADADGGESLVVVAEVDGDPDEAEALAAVRAAVLDEFELRVSDVLLVAPYTVPKTSSGKKQRSATRQLWERARQQPESLRAGAPG